jgi:hypothetical protein
MRFERRRDLPHLVGECEDGSSRMLKKALAVEALR